jgi:hypothetical protein
MPQLERLQHAIRQGRQRELPDDDIRSSDGGDHGLAVDSSCRERGVDRLRRRSAVASGRDRSGSGRSDARLLRASFQDEHAHDAGADVETNGPLPEKGFHQDTPHPTKCGPISS